MKTDRFMYLSFRPYFFTCKDDIRILHRSSLATFDCLMREIAVTSVSMAEPYSLHDASEIFIFMDLEKIIESINGGSKDSWSLML